VSDQWESFAYDALGEEAVNRNDRNATTHAYYYDVLGRPTMDQIWQLGANVDGAVQLLATAYDTYGNPYLFTSYNAPVGGSIVNQVQRAFNGLGQLTREWQSHSGAVDPNPTVTPSVQYAYSFDPAGNMNYSRLVSITYPNGRVVTYNYNTVGDASAKGIDYRISRVSSISDNMGMLESYVDANGYSSYVGLGTLVQRLYPQPNVELTYLQQTGDPGTGDAGDQYRGLDRFGRVVDQRWINPPNPTLPTDRFQYGYDRDGNRLYRDNLVKPTFGEIYHANAAGTGYDNLNQLTAFYRGMLSPTKDTIVGMPQHSQSWSLDVMGNWSSLTNDTNPPQARTHNRQNEVTSVGSSTLTFDNNGNTTVDDQGNVYVYDAWNRVVQVRVGGTGPALRYAYDALGRRIQEPIDSSHVRDLYFSNDWQVLEERDNAMPTTLVRSQYVWSPVYVDALVLRDSDPLGSGNFDQRLYVQQDANWNVTAVVVGKNFQMDMVGQIKERYVEDPYGQVTFLDPMSWLKHGTGPNGSSSVGWIYLHQGGRFDIVSGLYNFRHRDYSPTLGRWMETDPLRFAAADTNFYRAEQDSPANGMDPSGLYEDDVHFYMTYYLARAVGICPMDAELMATAATMVDKNPRTGPFGSIAISRLLHFPSLPGQKVVAGSKEAAKLLDDAINADVMDPVRFGVGLHPFEDSWSHEGYEAIQGHLKAGKAPDYPYTDVKRAMAMAQAVYKKMQDWKAKFCPGKPVLPWSEIAKKLERLFSLKGDKAANDLDTRIRNWQAQIKDDFKTDVGYHPSYEMDPRFRDQFWGAIPVPRPRGS
jgi:RHS repeat-associated protein